MNTNDYVKMYKQLYQNNQNKNSNNVSAYLGNVRQNMINNQQNVLNQKYNNPSSMQAQFNKAQTDLSNLNMAENQYADILQRGEEAQRQAGLQYQQGLKYAPSQLQAMGLGNTGLAETSQVGLQNAYQNILSQNRADTNKQVTQLYQDLANAQMQSQENLNKELAANEEEYRNQVIAGMNQAQTTEDLDKYYKLLGENVSPLVKLQYEQRRNAIEQVTQQAEKSKLGITPEMEQFAIDMSAIKPSDYNFVGSGKGERQDELISLLSKPESIQAIPNGTVIDINFGKGTDKYVILNGKLYPTTNPVTKGYQGEDLWNTLREINNIK